ncbi:Hypothetical protein HVR_LOCUS193 [uncultured virus]|nr:Hypothetical protein HVR_LOCUS193 [uncultured virus]
MTSLNLYIWLGGAAYGGSYLCTVADSLASARKAIINNNNDREIERFLSSSNDYVYNKERRRTVRGLVQSQNPTYIFPIEVGRTFMLDHNTG